MGGSYLGATKKEMQKIAENKGDVVVDLAVEASKKGGELSFAEIIKLHE